MIRYVKSSQQIFTSLYQIERTSKGIWFFAPMGVSLMVNAGIFASIIVIMYKNSANVQQLRLGNREGDTADR